MSKIVKQQQEANRRSRLQKEKPLAYEKIMHYPEKKARGESTAIIDFAYDYSCNLSCKHCMITKYEKKERVLTFDILRNIARQADELGLAQWVISGGEPMVFKSLDSIIEALMPDRFHIALNTNGILFTPEKARHLKNKGIDKLRVSIDSFHEEAYGKKKVSENRVLDALEAAKGVGMDVTILSVVTHQTVKSREFIDLLKFADNNGYKVDVHPARALGEWEGRQDLLIDDSDAEYLRELHEKYASIRWDMVPAYGASVKGCGSVESCLHISKYGEVHPCVFMPISLGNVFDDSLEDIIARGFNIKWFRNFQSKCLSGQDRDFINRYMKKCEGKPLPVSYLEIFDDEDFIDPQKK